jgi:diketogulonate reductase-like aldo/keto reductase
LVGQAIRGVRDRLFLASKVSPRHFHRHDVIKAAECSLKAMMISVARLPHLTVARV